MVLWEMFREGQKEDVHLFCFDRTTVYFVRNKWVFVLSEQGILQFYDFILSSGREIQQNRQDKEEITILLFDYFKHTHSLQEGKGAVEISRKSFEISFY